MSGDGHGEQHQGMYVVYRKDPQRPAVEGALDIAGARQPVGICLAPGERQAAAAFEAAWGQGLWAVHAPDAPTEDLLRVCLVALTAVVGEFRQMVALQQQAMAAAAGAVHLDEKLRGRRS